MAKLIALILPLGLDSFAVGAALALAGLPPRHRLRVSLLFASLEGSMPLIGLALGAPLGRTIGDSADYLAIVLLIAFGFHALLVGEGEEDKRIDQLTQRRGMAVLLLGLSVSLDELAIGFTLGLLRVPVIPVIIAIAAQAFVLSQLGLRLGTRLGERVREGAERIAGIGLTAVGITLLIEKLIAA